MSKFFKIKETKILLSGFQTGLLTFFMLGICLLFTTPNLQKFNDKTKFEIMIDVFGSSLYIFTGYYNLLSLYYDNKLTPNMIYSNAFMCWSAFYFGFIQFYTDSIATLDWLLKFDYWYTLPNFGWGIEWGLHLLGEEKCNNRTLVIILVSISSIVLDYMGLGKIGYHLAIVPQVIFSVLIAICGLFKYYSDKAFLNFIIFLSACMFFLILHEIDIVIPNFILNMRYYETFKILLIKICDNVQIHYSIRLFIEMFHKKNLINN